MAFYERLSGGTNTVKLHANLSQRKSSQLFTTKIQKVLPYIKCSKNNQILFDNLHFMHLV